MYQLAETQDTRIAQYTFGRSIAQFGVSVFSCNDARKGKKVFGNDPDPVKEIMLETQDDIISAHIKKHKKGKVAGYEKIIREAGQTYQVHHRTVMFGSTWKSDSLKPAGYSLVYHAGSHTHFRFPGLNRLTSQEDGGIVACSGFEDLHATNRKVHLFTKNDSFTPEGEGSIIVGMHDFYFHKTKVYQHYPFPISEKDTIQVTVTKPTVIVEFTRAEPDVAEFTKSWLNQIEAGLIEIVTR
jgi:hypothetical protein